MTDFINAGILHKASEDLKADLAADSESIELGKVVDVRVCDALQDLQDELEELCAVDVTFESELAVILKDLLIDIVG